MNSFQSEDERREIFERGQKALQLGEISLEALGFGQKYRKEIESPIDPDIEIRFISEEVGYGVFAKSLLKKGEFIGEYTGLVRENRRVYFSPLNNYCYEYPILDRLGRSYVIDATRGNFTRFINHSYRPNLKPRYAFIDGFYHCIFLAIKNIRRGEQLCYDYGQSYWAIRGSPSKL